MGGRGWHCDLCGRHLAGGMSVFEAIAHGFTTVSTGGFSTHDASLGYFNSQQLMLICDAFMLLGAINFGLHFRVVRSRDPLHYFRDEETRVFLLLIAVISITLGVYLYHAHADDSIAHALGNSLFLTVSFISSTGYGAADYGDWPVAACVSVLGPAFGELGNNFEPVSDAGTWVLTVAMLLGRLEYLTILVLLTPDFWKT